MAKRRGKDAAQVEGAQLLRRVFPLLAPLAGSGTQRDKAGNRRLKFSQYAGLVLVGLFNPILNSARGLVAASGLQKVRRLTGGGRVSLGSFSEAVSVFDPQLLEGLVQRLRSQWHHQQHLRRCLADDRQGDLPDELVGRLVAVDGTVLTALPQVVGRLGALHKGQWRLHAHVRVLDRLPLDTRLTPEPSTGAHAERTVLADAVAQRSEPGASHLYLMDRGYRSAELFNKLHQAGHDYICRLNRRDGRVVTAPVVDAAGHVLGASVLTERAQQAGVIADEFITLGGGCGASQIASDHPLRRITLLPGDERRSAARQGRMRTDQGGRDELILATSLRDLPAEQVVLLYEHRWQVELFFRFLKHVLKCDALLSAKTAGVQIQLYCALIAGLLFALATGNNLTKRCHEMICLYFSGWADEEELLDTLHRAGHPP
jgi:Transposase DDE domain